MFIYPIYNHNWRNISTIYKHITRLASNEIFSPSNKIHREVGRAKDVTAPLYKQVNIYWPSSARPYFTLLPHKPHDLGGSGRGRGGATTYDIRVMIWSSSIWKIFKPKTKDNLTKEVKISSKLDTSTYHNETGVKVPRTQINIKETKVSFTFKKMNRDLYLRK